MKFRKNEFTQMCNQLAENKHHVSIEGIFKYVLFLSDDCKECGIHSDACEPAVKLYAC